MKIYRVIVKYAGTDNIKMIKVTGTRPSAASIKGYWASRYNRTTYTRLYDVEVETLFATGWQPLNDEVERIETAITRLQASGLDQAEVFVQQLLDQIHYEKDREALRRMQAVEVTA